MWIRFTRFFYSNASLAFVQSVTVYGVEKWLLETFAQYV